MKPAKVPTPVVEPKKELIPSPEPVINRQPSKDTSNPKPRKDELRPAERMTPSHSSVKSGGEEFERDFFRPSRNEELVQAKNQINQLRQELEVERSLNNRLREEKKISDAQKHELAFLQKDRQKMMDVISRMQREILTMKNNYSEAIQ